MKPKNKAHIATIGAATIALSIIFLFAASIAPTGRFLLFAIATMLSIAVVIECGLAWAWTSYAATAILALFLVPDKTMVFLYILFFGYYGMVKMYIEMLQKLWLEWTIKMTLFAVVSYIIGFLLAGLIGLKLPANYSMLILWGIAIVGFTLYDIGYSSAANLYIHSLQRYLKFKR
ncbi:MAG: hypothetical protein H7Y41_01525 [Hyphomonadaceae bacterium]|nr:hypothetical protein [Clostridia bacterium]